MCAQVTPQHATRRDPQHQSDQDVYRNPVEREGSKNDDRGVRGARGVGKVEIKETHWRESV